MSIGLSNFWIGAWFPFDVFQFSPSWFDGDLLKLDVCKMKEIMQSNIDIFLHALKIIQGK